MKTILTLLLLVLSLETFAAFPARFKGVTKLETTLSSRLCAEERSIDLGAYLGITNRRGSLLELIGTISGGRFKNGDPNGINFLLWYLIFDSFGKDLVKTCEGAAPSSISERFRLMLTELCETSDWSSPKTKNMLTVLWTEVMSFEAPNAEQDKWLLELDQLAGETNQSKIKFALMLMFMNPYFLLEE